MKKKYVRISNFVVLLISLLFAVASCGPGSSSVKQAHIGTISKDISSAGKVTLVVWDQNTDGGMPAAQKQLNAEFEKKYPNVTIKRNVQSFSDLKTTLKLALSSNNPPDVVQANQGYPDMGAFVEAGMLRPLDDYSKMYKWNSYYPEGLIKLNSFSSNGKTWQGKSLYGISQTGELVGVYYNKSLLEKLGLKKPLTLDDLEHDMSVAKNSGILPVSFGDLDKSPGIHLFGIVQAALAGSKYVSNLVKGKSGSWKDDSNIKAAQTIRSWVEKGYLTKDANGVSKNVAAADFGRGEALFNIDGTWQQQTYASTMGESNVGFVTLNSRDGKPATTGGEGLAWAITMKSKHPDVAAAYINYINNSNAAKVLLNTGNLPAVLPASYKPKVGTVSADIAAEYRRVQKVNGVVPYLDYSTPTFYDTLTAGMQDVIAGKASPEEFTSNLQNDYATFLSKH